MQTFSSYSKNTEQIGQEISQILSHEIPGLSETDLYKKILSFIDLTTLEGSDNDAKIISVCEKAMSFSSMGPTIPNVAAVCFYPPFVKLAKEQLAGTEINIASVAGAFPSGQSPLKIRLEEIKYAVDEGADEIDMVISRGRFLAGDYQYVSDEIKAIKEVCGKAHLKVILETGELGSVENIRKASELAILAGADFIKTSTGKVNPAATLEALYVMAETVKEYHLKTQVKIGIKPAGGISEPETAIQFLKVLHAILGKEWMNKELFRFGASRLADKVLTNILS